MLIALKNIVDKRVARLQKALAKRSRVATESGSAEPAVG
jgi:hypothetical protein